MLKISLLAIEISTTKLIPLNKILLLKSKKQVMLVFRMQEIQKIQWILGCSEIIRFLTSTEFSCQKIDYNFRAKELIAILGSRKFIISLALKTKGFFCSEELRKAIFCAQKNLIVTKQLSTT